MSTQISTSALNDHSWNDDDRAIEHLHTRLNEKKDDTYVPLHIILRDAIWEDRDRLYTTTISRDPSPKRKRFTYEDELSTEDSYEDSYTTDEMVEGQENASDDENKAADVDTHMDKIIDNQIYRRFGYV